MDGAEHGAMLGGIGTGFFDCGLPAKGTLLHLLPDQHQAACVPHQNFHPIGALRAINNDRSRERILGQDFLRQGSKSMCAFAVMWCTT